MLAGTTAITSSPSRTRVPSTDASRPTRLIQPSRVSTTLVFSRTMYASGSNSTASSDEPIFVRRRSPYWSPTSVSSALTTPHSFFSDARIASIFAASAFFSFSSSRIFWISICAILYSWASSTAVACSSSRSNAFMQLLRGVRLAASFRGSA